MKVTSKQLEKKMRHLTKKENKLWKQAARVSIPFEKKALKIHKQWCKVYEGYLRKREEEKS